MSDATDPPLKMVYRNYKGEVAQREIVPFSLRYGTSDHHPEPQWLLEAYDPQKAANRTFALKDVLALDTGPTSVPALLLNFIHYTSTCNDKDNCILCQAQEIVRAVPELATKIRPYSSTPVGDPS